MTGFKSMRFARRNYLHSFLPFLVISVLYLFGLLLLFHQHQTAEEHEFVQRYATVLRDMKALYKDRFDVVRSDLQFLSRHRALLEYFSNTGSESLNTLNREYLLLADVKKVYDQVRFLDTKGWERIRINYNGLTDRSSSVPPGDLQDKSDRYYFQNSIHLDGGDIYVSPFDLNVEHGEVELPYKPIIRFATPVFDRNYRRRGVVILNYLGAELIRSTRQMVPDNTGLFTMTDGRGYWIIGEKPDDEWGFMFPDGKEKTMAVRNPDVWLQSLRSPYGTIGTKEGIYIHFAFHPVTQTITDLSNRGGAHPAADKYPLHFFYFIPHAAIRQKTALWMLDEWPVFVGIYLLLSILAILAGITIYMRRRAILDDAIVGRIFSNAEEGIVITDDKTVIIKVNTAFSRITGYPAEEVMGRTPSMLRSGWSDLSLYQEMWQSLDETGRWEGELLDRRKDGILYSEWIRISSVRDSRGRVTHYVGIFTDITEKKTTRERIHHLAYYDLLTDLPNRMLFHDRLVQAIYRMQREKGRLALLYIDLDNFKYLNDTLGHFAGDHLLQSLATRIKSVITEHETLARPGGDEFALILEAIEDVDRPALVAEKILQKITEPTQILNQEVRVSASIGIALYPDDADDLSLLIRNAETAMYRAKEDGREGFAYFKAEMNSVVVERVNIESRLRKALERGNELELFFQPQVDAESGRVVGAEALLRWNNPELGSVSPVRFIPVAEETGLITTMGEWTIRRACEELATLRDEGWCVKIAVNASLRNLEQEDFVSFVEQTLQQCGSDPADLEIEITESLLARDAKTALANLTGLRNLGVSVAIDDFGTGYSSLQYLKKYPIDKLKIDRSFVTDLPDDPDDVRLSTAIIGIARAFSMRVLAEGVEKESQVRFLMENGCRIFQGYYFSRPLSSREFREFVREHSGTGGDISV